MTDRALVREWIERTRAVQGLPPDIRDQSALHAIALVLLGIAHQRDETLACDPGPVSSPQDGRRPHDLGSEHRQ